MAIFQHKKTCPYCGADAKEKSVMDFGDSKFVTLECGHDVIQDKITGGIDKIVTKDGREPYPFQYEGIKFAEENDARVLIADEMGLGKTVQALALIRKHPELLPCAIICKSGLRTQWFHEVVRWLDTIPQIITSSKDVPHPEFFRVFIISREMMANIKWMNDPEHKHWLKVKCVIADEVQGFKNVSAARTQAFRRFTKEREHIVGLSGTPIENNAIEYFPILNILRPERFPSYNGFIRTWVDAYYDGYKAKAGGIAPRMLEQWREAIKDIVIRRKMDDVMKDMPQIRKMTRIYPLGEEVEREYRKTFEEFQDYMEGASDKKINHMDTLAYLSHMRHLTGIAKVEPITDFVAEFLMETNRKYAIFVHHKNVGQLLKMKIGELCRDGGFAEPLEYTSEMNSQQRDSVKDKFINGPHRIFILSTQAAGEGLDGLQKCCWDVGLAERQWNPPKENQAIVGRLRRIGTVLGKDDFINITYFLAEQTIDEMLTELVARKGSGLSSTLDFEESKWNEESTVKELADLMLAKGRRRWGK